MATMELSSADPVEVSGDQGTVGAFAFPADAGTWGITDVDPGAVYFGYATLVGDDDADRGTEDVVVSPADPAPARRLVHEALPPGTAEKVRAMLSKANVVGTLATEGARIPAYRQDGTAIHAVFPQVLETEPDGLVVVTEETNLESRAIEEK